MCEEPPRICEGELQLTRGLVHQVTVVTKPQKQTEAGGAKNIRK